MQLRNKLSLNVILVGQPLTVIAFYKDLGVNFDNKRRFNLHYVDVLRKALRMSGLIVRFSYQFMGVHSSVILYNSHVRNILEYPPYCSPLIISDCHAIEPEL